MCCGLSDVSEEKYFFVADSLSLHSNAAVLNLQHFSLWSKYCSLSTGVFIGS